MHKGGGFTLAELLIVVAIIAVLVAVAIPTFGNQLERSRQSVDLSNLRGAYAAAKVAVLNGGTMSSSGSLVKFDPKWCIGGTDLKTITSNGEGISFPSTGTGAAYPAVICWYKPEDGSLILTSGGGNSSSFDGTYIASPLETVAPDTAELKEDKGNYGKAQSTTVVVDTKELPGAGDGPVFYSSGNLKIASGGSVASIASGLSKAGTLNRGIRVVLAMQSDGTYDIADISYVSSSGEPLLKAW